MPNKKNKILIVEDDFYIRELYIRELKKSQFDVRSAETVKQGLNEIAKDKPDLIMLDIMLPIHSGFELLEKVKKDENLKDIIVIILSNLGEDDVIKEGFAKGSDGYLIKASHTPKQIVIEVERYLQTTEK